MHLECVYNACTIRHALYRHYTPTPYLPANKARSMLKNVLRMLRTLSLTTIFSKSMYIVISNYVQVEEKINSGWK